jgi:hypothetical protein
LRTEPELTSITRVGTTTTVLYRFSIPELPETARNIMFGFVAIALIKAVYSQKSDSDKKGEKVRFSTCNCEKGKQE